MKEYKGYFADGYVAETVVQQSELRYFNVRAKSWKEASKLIVTEFYNRFFPTEAACIRELGCKLNIEESKEGSVFIYNGRQEKCYRVTGFR